MSRQVRGTHQLISIKGGANYNREKRSKLRVLTPYKTERDKLRYRKKIIKELSNY
jgi:hypothetical protein